MDKGIFSAGRMSGIYIAVWKYHAALFIGRQRNDSRRTQKIFGTGL